MKFEGKEKILLYASSFPYISAQETLAYVSGVPSKGGREFPPSFLRLLTGGEGEKKGEWIFDRSLSAGISVITYLDPHYPVSLTSPGHSPPALYYKGDLSLLDGFSGSIVGSRKPTIQGLTFCTHLAGELARLGIGVVSGFARGIDSCAHRSALVNGGSTVAVLGSGVDIVYPGENERLYKDIEEKGCILSRFPPGTAPLKHNFPVRNRMIAALSEFTAVVEAAKKSGSLITARFALDLGREVFSVPGSPLYPQSEGTNMLIKKGASPLTCVEDVLQNFGFSPERVRRPGRREKVRNLTEGEERVFESLQGRMTIDEISLFSKRGVREVTSTLLTLEMKGLIKRGEDGRFERNGGSLFF